MTEKQPPSYPLRMPQELRERLTEAAKANNRSMNAEIVARLERSFQDGDEDFEQGFRSVMQEKEIARLNALLDEKHRKVPTADEIADKVAERLPAMILEKLKQAAPDYAKPRRPLPPEGSDQ